MAFKLGRGPDLERIPALQLPTFRSLPPKTTRADTDMNGDFSLDEQRGLEDYRRLSDLFQFYLQLVLSTFTFALGIAGGVCAFVLGKDVPNPRLASFGLLLPAALCTGLGYAFIKSRKSSEELHSALDRLKKQLNRELAPHAGNLTASLKWFGILLVSVIIIPKSISRLHQPRGHPLHVILRDGRL